MNPILIPAVALFAIAALGILGLRRFSNSVRFLFDIAAFATIGAYFWRENISPVFPPVGSFDVAALWMRAIGGAWWLLGARIIVAVLRISLNVGGHARQATLFSDLFGAVIYIAATLVILNSVFSLPVTGLLATSGVLAIVLGLALQNTLADVFAGMAVGVEKPFGVGDRIQIDNKVEGHVTQMNWRSIRLQTDGDDIAIVPNSQIAKAEIVNRSCPGHRRAASVYLGCPASATPERVVEMLRQAILLCPDILGTPEPRASLTRLGGARNIYTISFFVDGTRQLSPTKDHLLRSARRQLYFSGLLDEKVQDGAGGKEDIVSCGRRLLTGLIVFEGLTAEQVNYLAKRLELRLLEPGETLFEEGTVDARLYVIASGVVKFTRCMNPSTVTIIGSMGAGEYVGELGLLTGAAHSATATAQTYCRIYLLPQDAIAPLLAESPELAAAFDKSLRHGLNVLYRQTTANTPPETDPDDRFLHRIERFFQSHLLHSGS